ncbi:MAG: TraR/DksA family transcriptional regulator [Gemmatimonadota bacterium]|nr:TraR/DksA family transcriptional regulator [Gemmatimonadota bacterium]
MNEKDLRFFREILEEKRLSIVEDLGMLEQRSMHATSEEASGGQIYSDHMPELGSDSIEREKAFLFASRDGAYLTQVEDALERIERGTFGACRVCEKEIPKARLEAVPTTRLCVPCKENEQRQGFRAT